jgi:uncharacterized protein (DUF779 family)
MGADTQGRLIQATAAASEALRRMQAEYGKVVLHIPGGAEDAGSPVCLREVLTASPGTRQLSPDQLDLG